jgi:type II secretory pathway pseudopilin PulG
MRHAQQGASLLEMIVALTLIATLGMALLSWVNANLITLNRVKAVDRRMQMARVGLQYMTLVNPMARPEGEERLDALRIVWHSTLTGGKHTGEGYPQGTSLFDVGLYDVDVSVHGHQDSTRFRLRLVGYHKTRNVFNADD